MELKISCTANIEDFVLKSKQLTKPCLCTLLLLDITEID